MLMLLLAMALQAVPAPSPATPRDSALYVVGPNDVLTITVFNQAQLSGQFVIEADGAITYPLLGRVALAGLSIREVEDVMRKRLAAGYVRDPQVSVAIEQYRSQQVFVMGEVRQPGSLQFTGSMTLIEALARAGSTTENAGTEAVIVRPRYSPAGSNGPTNAEGQGDNETIRVDLQRLQTGTLTENVVLRPGDTVFVPRAKTAFVLGHVRTPGEYVVRPKMTVRQVLALAGGMTERASTRRIQVIREVDGKEVTGDAKLQDIVYAGDTIVVRERLF